jgi:hypothetical protein
MVMSDLTTQVRTFAFHRIELGRIGGQANQFDLVLMLGQKGLHWFGKVDAIIIHHDILFARRLSRFWPFLIVLPFILPDFPQLFRRFI